MIQNSTDTVIGLKAHFEPSFSDDGRYSIRVDEDGLNLTVGDPSYAPVEVIINGTIGRTGGGMVYYADGFYLVKFGGSYAAGATSYGLIPVDEALLRLNSDIKVQTEPLP